MLLKDKVCIITGAANGIGRAAALKFGGEGARVIVCDLNQEAVDAVVAEVKAAGGEALGFRVDVTDKATIAAMVDGVMAAFGRVDALVNNAGIIMDARLQKMTDEQFDRVIEVNLKGTYNCTRAVVDIMVGQQAGSIINTSSIVGLYGNFGQTNYAATKFGVIGFAKTWAKELGRYNVRANAVAPGFIATHILDSMPEKVIEAMKDKVPMKRLGRPEEIANAYAWLASDESSYVNGVVIEVGGGVSL